MDIRHTSISSVTLSLIITVLILLCLQLSFAQVRSSTNYRLQSDSVNIGGGLSSSTNYTQESTAGEVATEQGGSTNYQLRAGYQQMQEVYLSLSSAGDVVLSPNIGGITGGTSNGSTTVTVITDSPAGYSLTIKGENSPAMRSGANSIPDYNGVGANPDFSFITPTRGSAFGFSPVSVDTVQAFLDNGSNTCNTGATNSLLSCWEGLTTTAQVISSGSAANHPNGAITTINFRVGVASNAGVVSGLYVATSTLTALPL